MSQGKPKKGSVQLLASAEVLSGLVEDAFGERGLEAKPLTRQYIIQMLQHYLCTENLFGEDETQGRSETMAEKLLGALNSDPTSGQGRAPKTSRRHHTLCQWLFWGLLKEKDHRHRLLL